MWLLLGTVKWVEKWGSVDTVEQGGRASCYGGVFTVRAHFSGSAEMAAVMAPKQYTAAKTTRKQWSFHRRPRPNLSASYRRCPFPRAAGHLHAGVDNGLDRRAGQPHDRDYPGASKHLPLPLLVPPTLKSLASVRLTPLNH
jgi:hypothetical protein